MKRVTGEVLESDIDWMTATGFSSEAQELMQNFGARLLISEGARGNDTKPWRFAGYEGFKCGSVQCGSRPDSSCVRLGSVVAAENWRELYRISEGISRVDLQLTVRTDDDPVRCLAAVHRQALRFSAKRKDGPSVTLIRGNDGSATVYLGKRESDVFGRAYAKGVESGLDHYKGTVRFEVEFKGGHCLSVLRHLIASPVEAVGIVSCVCGFFKSRGCALSLPCEALFIVRCSRSQSDNTRRLEWLRKQVRPSVQHLIASGCYDEVIRALGLSVVQLDHAG